MNLEFKKSESSLSEMFSAVWVWRDEVISSVQSWGT